MAEEAFDICPSATSSSSAVAPAPPASIEDCPEEDLNAWPHAWKVYGSKCYTLIGAPTLEWSNAKQHCEDVKYHPNIIAEGNGETKKFSYLQFYGINKYNLCIILSAF